jgi:CubicO group peptidase (beta-lactamase class C family)
MKAGMLHRLFTMLIIPALLLLPGGSCSSTPPPRPISFEKNDYSYLADYLSWLVPAVMKKHDIAGLSLALIQGQETIIEKHYGLADREEKIPASEKTLYRVASITKLFTATAIMRLVEQGGINLDSPLTAYIPEFSIKSRFAQTRPITVRMLMTHHSGIPSDRGEGLFDDRPEPYHSVLAYLREQYLSYPPGTVYCYSNLGVNLLGIVIERVSGTSYHDYISEHILKPLGMTQSFFKADETRGLAIAGAYSGKKKGMSLEPRDMPSVSLISTLSDLKRFMMMVTGRGAAAGSRVLEEDTLESMLTQQNRENALDFDIKTGLMWMMSRQTLNYQGRIVMHRGISLHHRSVMIILPDDGLGITILTNSESGTEGAREIADRALALALDIQREAPAPALAPTPSGRRTLTAEERELLPGSYATLKGMVTIRLIENGLWAKIMGHHFKLVPGEDGMFSPRFSFFAITPRDFRLGVVAVDERKNPGDGKPGAQDRRGREVHSRSAPRRLERPLRHLPHHQPRQKFPPVHQRPFAENPRQRADRPDHVG